MGAHEKKCALFYFFAKNFCKKNADTFLWAFASIGESKHRRKLIARRARAFAGGHGGRKKAALKNISDAHLNARRLSRTSFMREIAPNKCAG